MRRRFATLLTTILFGCLIAHAAPAAQALAVSPVLYDYEIAPGAGKQGTITLVNDTETADTFSLEVKNFVAQGEEGAQQYLDEQEPSDLASWITVNRPSVTLGPGQSADFPFAVNVPSGAEPGGHYASIFFSRKASNANGTGVGIGGKVGVLILVNVPGDVREDARIESFNVQGPLIRDRLPVYFDLRIHNLGSVHFRPRGSLVVKNLFGRLVEQTSVNPKNAAVLPNSIRRVESVWANTLTEDPSTSFWSGVMNEWHNFAFGRYEATASVIYGSKAGQLASQSVTFWVIPWRILLIALGALVVLVALVKTYNALLVRSALKKDAKRSRRSDS
jgi:hypothetical protein